jgi:hypothetical protein
MKSFYRGPTAIATAALIVGVALVEPVSNEPHAHDGQNAPVELILHTGLSASGGFTNTSATILSTSPIPTWVLPSSSATFIRDLVFADRLGQVGITVLVELDSFATSPFGRSS